MIDSLLAKGDLDERDYLDVLSDLVEKFEAEDDPFPAASDAGVLRHLIEARGLSRASLSADTGIAGSAISAVLAGKRGLTRGHIATLARYFRLSQGAFLGG